MEIHYHAPARYTSRPIRYASSNTDIDSTSAGAFVPYANRIPPSSFPPAVKQDIYWRKLSIMVCIYCSSGAAPTPSSLKIYLQFIQCHAMIIRPFLVCGIYLSHCFVHPVYFISIPNSHIPFYLYVSFSLYI